MRLCECGCGTPTRNGSRYVQFHHLSKLHADMRGPGGLMWKGGRIACVGGYVRVWNPDHPRAYSEGYVHEHVVVVEAAMGKHLRPTAPVHHVNGDKHDNRPCNLVACNDTAYHALLHARQRALDECGHADWLMCAVCRTWDAQENLRIYYNRHCRGRNVVHRECNAAAQRKIKARKREAA